MAVKNWTCPHCHRATTITDVDQSIGRNFRSLDDNTGVEVQTTFIECPNPECKKITLFADFRRGTIGAYDMWVENTETKSWNLIPNSNAISLPNYIPQAVSNDYYEACSIRELSPKASATLSRRCLQGMIRDFWNVKKGSLNEEIEGIKEKLDPGIYSAINSLRSIGNIGAHMEKDINIIIDVEPDEAETLIKLIEILIDEWYVARNRRNLHIASIEQIAAEKKSQKKPAKPA